MNTGELKVLGLVGARSGSKGVPHKNVRHLDGKPLVGRIVEKACRSKYINRVIVSTDSESYAEVARKHGADVPFLRPQELASDKAPEFEYVKHALAWLKEHEGYEPDIVVRMMSTVPLQSTEDIDASIEALLLDPDADSCVVIAEARQHPVKALKIIEDETTKTKRLVTYFGESGREVTPLGRQAYEKAYFRANIIACRTRTIYETESLTGDHVLYHVIPQERAVDIDSPIDFFLSEQLLKYHGLGERMKKEATVVRKSVMDETLASEPGTGKRLLEPLRSVAIEHHLPFKILEDAFVMNDAEVHKDEGDLWICLEGTVTFVCGGEIVDAQYRTRADGTENDREVVGSGIEGGKEFVLLPGDWLWIPPGVAHVHGSSGVARMGIIKIPA